jgi:MFS family permease
VRTSLRRWWSEGERWYWSVGLANLVLGTSSILIPLMVSRVFHRSTGTLGLLASLVSLVGVVGSLVWGRLSDAAHRRKPFMTVSYGVVGVSFAVIAFARTFDQLLLLNMLLNLFWVANASVTVLIVTENRSQASWERKIGHLNQIGAVGWVAGLAVGSGALAAGARLVPEENAIRVLFLLIAAGGIVASFLASRWVPRTRPVFTHRRFRGAVLAMGNFLIERARFAPFHLYYRIHPRQILAQLRHPQGFRPGTKRFLTVTLLTFLALGLSGIPLPLLLAERFGFGSSSVFLYFTVQHLAIAFAYPLAARRIKRLGNRRVQMGTIGVRLALFFAAAVYLAWATTPPATPILLIAFAIYGFSWSYLQLSGVALTSRLARPTNRGLALGLYNALAGIGWILAGVGSGYLAEWGGYQAAFGASAGVLLLALLLMLAVPEPGPPTEAPRAVLNAEERERLGESSPPYRRVSVER